MTLKDELFNRNQVTILANLIHQVYLDFKKDDFINKSVDSFPVLELKERMSSVRNYLKEYLPNDYVEAIDILTKAMDIRTGGGFIYGSVLEYVEVYGCTDEYVDVSLEKLGEWTDSLSSEFAIRPFLNNYPEETMKKVMEWTTSEDVHKRRLASEGTRPSLPWAMKISLNYKDAAQPLDNLYYDQERYVTRSVANHLNDISKIDPSYVLGTLRKWKKENKQESKELEYMMSHSLRTLVKKGHPDTLEFLGYKLSPKVEVVDFALKEETIHIGDSLDFAFTINSKDTCKVVVDYIVKYPSTTKKVPTKTYKLKALDIEKNKTYDLKGKRSFKKISTRKMRPGIHTIEIQINGQIFLEKTFNVI